MAGIGEQHMTGCLQIDKITQTTVTIKWDRAVGDIDNYCITCQSPGEYLQEYYADPEEESFQLTDLKPNTHYSVTLKPVCWDNEMAAKPISADVVTEPKAENTFKTRFTAAELSTPPADPRNQEYDDKMVNVEKILLGSAIGSGEQHRDMLSDLLAFGSVPPPPMAQPEELEPYMTGPLQITEITSTSVMVTWTSAVGDFDNYCICCWCIGEVDSTEYYADPIDHSYPLIGLRPDTRYRVSVKPVCWKDGSAGEPILTHFMTDPKLKSTPGSHSTKSADSSFKKNSRTKEREEPAMIGQLHIEEVTCVSATITWSPAIGDFDHYCISCQRPRSKTMECYVDPGLSKYRLTELTPNTQYTVSVKPVCWDQEVTLEPIYEHFVTAYQATPGVEKEGESRSRLKKGKRQQVVKKGASIDGAIVIKDVTDTSLTVQWNAATGKFDGYKVPIQGPDGEVIVNEIVPADTTELELQSLMPDKLYTVSVKPMYDGKPVGDGVSVNVVTGL